MTLNASGPISLAGSTTGQSIAVELGQSATGTIALNDSAVRTLAGVASGAITMPTDFWGKPLGQFWMVGGIVNLAGAGGSYTVSSPVQIGTGGWTFVSGSTGISSSGSLWNWGRNLSGQLGLNDRIARSSPVQVGALTNWKIALSSGFTYGTTAAIKTDGTLWSWGASPGDNQGTRRSSPVQIGALTTWYTLGYMGGLNTPVFAIKTDGTLWGWGKNVRGQIGDNTTIEKSSPVQIGAGTNWKFVASAGGSSAYNNATAAVKTDGTLWTWGSNANGLLASNATVFSYRSSPVQVGALTNWGQISATTSGSFFSVKTDGTLWCWGNNGFGTRGVLGLNDAINRSSPTQIGAATDWYAVAGTEGNAFAIKAASSGKGQLWSWGNALGVGQNDYIARSSPVQVGSLTTWALSSVQNSTGGGPTPVCSVLKF